MGSDIPHIVSAVAKHFGWVSVSEETARLATHKFLMKERFRERGIPIPNYARVQNAEEIYRHWQTWQCPSVIIKPVNQAGSRGVRKLDHKADIEAAFQQAKQMGEVILEEFVPGLQISTESVITHTQSVTPGFADRVYTDTEQFWPHILENGGWIPTCLAPDQQKAVCELVENAARALGIEQGIAKGDVVICPKRGPMMIEMAARLSGGDFSETMVPKGTGVNYVKAALQIALGQDPDWRDLKPKFIKPIANRYFFAPPGNLEEIQGIEEVLSWPEIVKFDLWYQAGDVLPPITHHGVRTGVFILQGQSREQLQTLIDEVYNKVRFKINGRWESGMPYSTG
jgi:biotin carboxylase